MTRRAVHLNRAAFRTASEFEADYFASDKVLLVGKGEADEGGCIEIQQGGPGKHILVVVAHKELNALKMEWGGLSFGAQHHSALTWSY